MKRIILLGTTLLLSTAVLAGGSIFGGHSKSKNYNGVKALAVELCGVDICPKFRILEGDCDTEHTYKRYGTCLCEEGYVPKEGKCEPCPDGYYSDGQHECTKCGPGEYSIKGSTECGKCPDNQYSPGGTTECYECPKHAECTNKTFKCETGFHSIGGSYETLKCIPDCPSDAPYWNGAKCVECLENIHCDCFEGCVFGQCTGIDMHCSGGDFIRYCDPLTHKLDCVHCYNNPDGTCVGCTDQYPVCTDDHQHKICTSDTECPNNWKCAIDNSFGYTGCYEPCDTGLSDVWGGIPGMPAYHTCCPTEKPAWDGSECVECTKDEHCDTGYMCDKQECKARECDIETYPRTTPPQNCTKYDTCVSPTETRYTLCQQCETNTIWYNNECSISKGKCPPGFYCPEDGCPDGYWCPGGPDPIPCPEGKYCPEGSIAPTPCPAGSYCPAGGFGGSGGSWGGGFDFGGGGASGYLTCPEKYFCPAGTVTPIDCPADYYCEGETVEPIPCPQGYYCPPRTCIPIECGPSPWIGKWPTGCYLPCVNGTYTIPEGQSRGSCVCTEGWTGTLCDIEACDTTEYPLTEKPDEGAYTFETCEDSVKHYKKTGCTATHIDEDSNGICINKCEAKANAHDKVCETCSVDELGNVTIAPVVSRTTCANPDGETGNTDYVCATNSSGRGVCKDPCTIGAHADFVATTCFTDQHAENGRCVPTYADTETSCINPLYPGVGSFCDGYGECGCPDGKMYSPILQQCVVPSGTGCKSNSGCDIGQFCEVTSYSSSKPYNTQCQLLDYLPNETFEIQTVNGRKKVIHTTSASQAQSFKWDTGLNWCKAQGGRLASLTDFGITHCNDSGKSLNMCASTTVYVKGADGNYTKWSDYYKTLSADDKYNWNKLTTYNWMSEPYNSGSIYEFNPSNGSITYHTYSHSCTTLYHILCVLDEGVSCPTNSSYRKTPPSGSEEPTSVSNCYCNTATPHWNNSKNSCVACNQETDCATGYVCTNNACQPRDCSAFPLNACDSTHGTCDTCQSASVPKYKLTCDTGYYKTSDSATSCTECKTDSTSTCSSCPAETPYWTGENCVACDETIDIPQTAVFAHDTPKGATELIAQLGPYKCAYDVYVKGHIDDTFLITDMDGNTLCGGGTIINDHEVEGIIYRIMPNTQIKIYAQDNYAMYLGWELHFTQGGRTGTPEAPILELRRVQSAENYCKGSQL